VLQHGAGSFRQVFQEMSDAYGGVHAVVVLLLRKSQNFSHAVGGPMFRFRQVPGGFPVSVQAWFCENAPSNPIFLLGVWTAL